MVLNRIIQAPGMSWLVEVFVVDLRDANMLFFSVHLTLAAQSVKGLFQRVLRWHSDALRSIRSLRWRSCKRGTMSAFENRRLGDGEACSTE